MRQASHDVAAISGYLQSSLPVYTAGGRLRYQIISLWNLFSNNSEAPARCCQAKERPNRDNKRRIWCENFRHVDGALFAKYQSFWWLSNNMGCATADGYL